MSLPQDGPLRKNDYGLVCIETNSPLPRASIYSRDAFKFLNQVFLVQISLISLMQGLCHAILKPIGGTPVVSHMLAGVLIGPSVLGQNKTFLDNVFPNETMYKLETLGKFGCMIYLFLIGVKMDLNILKRSSKMEKFIGFLIFKIPLLLTVPLASHINKTQGTTSGMDLPLIATLESSTSFHVVSIFLADLKILNTEVGYLAISVSAISGLCSWINLTIATAVKQNTGLDPNRWICFVISMFAQILFITTVLRRLVLWIIKQTPRGETIKEIHLFAIFVMVLATGLMGEWFGQHWFFGPIILGLSIPEGPPVGSALEDKLGSVISGLLLPIFFFYVGSKTNIHLAGNTMGWVGLLTSLGMLGKLIATIVPCLFYGIHIKDAFVLGLILCSRGVFDIAVYSLANSIQYTSDTCFTWQVVNSLVVTAVISPLVYWLYNPSTSYFVNKKRTIQNAKIDDEFRALVCVYDQASVPTTIELLDASNPSKESPIAIYLLHLVDLVGRSSPLLITHKPNKKLFGKPSYSDHIINSFKIYEKQNNGVVNVQPFTAITPFVSAHDEICRMALDKRTSLIILPFHKQWDVNGTSESSKCRNVNRKVLNNAPCTVGILIDRGRLNRETNVVSNWMSAYNIGVVFLGGEDDREALCYAMRMAKHSSVCLCVHRIIPNNNMTIDINEIELDNNLIDEYRHYYIGIERNQYKEEQVVDSLSIVNVIQSMENAYNLVLVGRRQDAYSTLLSELMEWNEYPELGFFGDMFTSADFKSNVSVLVMSCISTNVIFDS